MPRQSTLTPEQRSLHAQLAAHSRWAREDPRAGTLKARTTFLSRFEREVDPYEELPPAERQRRAECARKAYYARLQLASSRARLKRKAAATRVGQGISVRRLPPKK